MFDGSLPMMTTPVTRKSLQTEVIGRKPVGDEDQGGREEQARSKMEVVSNRAVELTTLSVLACSTLAG